MVEPELDVKEDFPFVVFFADAGVDEFSCFIGVE